ncbi:hypothetical protein EII29_04425 [Leptotrichia sp. OH3620_COT-345]|uniref:J domain-containing protein n=1 Tax=Leptotrichia sp. OH3620_COT-345 TaxID=2491048 RepID=UPI000F6474C2|nr:J domain-containing protein [Leptotrichia sp. OH3620_COT-345]RRD40057.1 hypothetical protein EII29_04425 [Leptotrichia sp. OH3620_COT-345]
MQIIGRGMQFLLTGICLLIKIIINVFWKLYIFVIGILLFFTVLMNINSWKLFWEFLFLGFQVLVAGFLTDFVNSWTGKIFGNILNEEEEDKDIFEKYKKQFFYQNKRSEYNSEQSNYSSSGYSNYSGYSEYKENKYENYSKARDDIVKKYEEYLEYFGINTKMKITLKIIKKAYKTKIKEVHPDKNPGKDTTEETVKVNEIKEFLDINLEYYLMKRGF